MSKKGCVKQTTKKYTSRSSPPFPANECKDEKMTGNDGLKYFSKADSRGIYKWVKVNVTKAASKRRSPAKKAASKRRSPAKKAVSKRRSPAKRSRVAKKAVSKRRSPVKRSRVAKKTASKRRSPAKKTASKRRSPAKKTASKRRSPAKKAVSKRRSPAKKAVSKRRSPAKKTASKRRSPNKSVKKSNKITYDVKVLLSGDKKMTEAEMKKLVDKNNKKVISLYKKIYKPISKVVHFSNLNIKHKKDDVFTFSYNLKDNELAEELSKDFVERPDDDGNYPLKLDGFNVLLRGKVLRKYAFDKNALKKKLLEKAKNTDWNKVSANLQKLAAMDKKQLKEYAKQQVSKEVNKQISKQLQKL
jgi:hypothetical protein